MENSNIIKLFLFVTTMAIFTIFVFGKWAVPIHYHLAAYIRDRVEDTFRRAGLRIGEEESGLIIEHQTVSVKSSTGLKKYLLDSKSCLIPDIDPFTGGRFKMTRIECTGTPSLTYVEGSYLRINWTRIRAENGGRVKYCQYFPVIREVGSDFEYGYGPLSEQFDHDILVPPEHEYMKVHCYGKTGHKLFTNFHAVVTERKEVEERSNRLFKKHKKERKPKETFNVLFLGMDSASRLNFMRRLPQTRKFLLEDLKAFEMTGYTKVADNTFPNIVPMTTGKYLHEFGGEKFLHETFDRHHFFWKNFSQAGYRTLFAEDDPSVAIFSYRKLGFENPPTDYYNRHLQLALEDEKSIWNSAHHCIGDKMESKYLLDYITEYSRVFEGKPHFGFTFITRLTHDQASLFAAAEAPYLEFFKGFKREQHFNNTILIFFGDHGLRFGKERNSYVGKIEDRLPMLYLVFPQKFHNKYPRLVRNLRANSKRLTSAFDIYETVKDIINFDGRDRKANVTDRGISLLREIPKERTCDHAQINPHWCMCLGEEKLNTTNQFAIDVGNGLIRVLNSILAPIMYKCAWLTLGNITDLVEKKSSARITKTSLDQDQFELAVSRPKITNAPLLYQVTISALPSHALFEATLFHDSHSSKYHLVGDVSRINRYDKQSECVHDYRLKTFCFCI